MMEVSESISRIRERIAGACLRSGRDPESVELIAVSKTFPEQAVREAVEAGQTAFGESRIQEAAPKIEALPPGLVWHFIGGIQRNKVRKILPVVHFTHAVDSMKLMRYMDGVAADLGLTANIFLQVNQGGEESKGGFAPASLRDSMDEICSLRHLNPVGLMSIPPPAGQPEDSRNWFRELRELRDGLASESDLKLPYLSMGMSDDFEVAVEEGATHVRVGSAIFGNREYKIEGELG